MPHGHNDHSQNFIVNFVDDAVIANANAPGVAVLKFFAAGRTWVGFQFSQLGENAFFRVT